MAVPELVTLSKVQSAPQRRRKLSVVVPGLNEERSIPALIERLQPVLDGLGLDWEVIFVDDGSTDGTLTLLRTLNARDARFKAVALSRNFGKEIAAAAGLTYVTGDGAVMMDADLQHPPELIEEFVAALERRLRHRLRAGGATAMPTACCIVCRRGCSTPPSRSSAVRCCPKAPAISACSIARRSTP